MNSSPFTGDFSGLVNGASSFLDYVDLRDRADVLSGLIACGGVGVGPETVNFS
jgi:hypothetical protein